MAEISSEDLRSLLIETDSLAQKLEAAESELSKRPTASILSPDELAELVGRFLAGLDSQLSGMRLRDSGVCLKVGSGEAGHKKGFAAPDPAGDPGNLHGISVRIQSTRSET